MDYSTELQRVLDVIDERIIDKLSVNELSRTAGFSPWHFSRIFQAATGYPVMYYVTKRKLEFALADLCGGKKVIDVAVEYGFETHAGFTKAFKRYFGFSPATYRLRVGVADRPGSVSINQNKISGGISMSPQLLEIKPFTIAGYPNRYTLPNVRSTRNVPAWWETVNLDYSTLLTKLYDTLTPSKHGEYGICMEADLESGEFTYMLAVGVDKDNLAKIEPDMMRLDLPGGLYAVFTTPWVPNAQYAASIRDTWKGILLDWFPDSEYVFDESRRDFEAYDERDHFREHDMVQMDIYIPIKKKK